ncbi:MAG: hypothetical protein O7H41_21150 [Planctomycetota bacterium]|nr:hypothetical protein [Planctomycetota bacterium]
MRSVSSSSVIGLVMLSVTIAGCGGGGGGKKPGNSSPIVGAPSGPGTVVGSDPTYTTVVNIGDFLDLSVIATDPNTTEMLSLTGTITGGTLLPGQAGFTSIFPASMSGTTGVTLSLLGTAAMGGDIELTFDVVDARTASHTITLTIFINSAPIISTPTGPGAVAGVDPDYTTIINTPASLAFTVTATDVDASDTLTLIVSITGGTLTSAQAGFTTFPTMATGPSPQQLLFDGTAMTPGSLQLTIDVLDGVGGTDQITHTITINASPQIGRPTGPGTVGGSNPTYTSTVPLGGSLFFDVVATDADLTDTLTFTASLAPGSPLDEVQAGFNEMLPLQMTGMGSVALTFTGTAAMLGSIQIDFSVDDGNGATDMITHTIQFNSTPQVVQPTGPGLVAGSDPTYTGNVNLGDSLDFMVSATDPDVGDLITLSVMEAAGGSITAADAGFAVLPGPTTGASPQTLALTGTAAMEGFVILTISVDDGRGGIDTITHTITVNSPPVLGMPTGPGTVGGTPPNFTTQINVGDALNLMVTATDLNVADTLTLSVMRTGGTLLVAQAGFNPLPGSSVGASPQTLSATGTAAMGGNIVLVFDVDDGNGLTDQITLDIFINSTPVIGQPTGPGVVAGADPAYTTIVNLTDSLVFDVTATDTDATDTLTFTVTDTLTGTITAVQAGFGLLPGPSVGVSAQMLSFTGTAAMEGDVVLMFLVDDGNGSTDTIMHTILVNSCPLLGMPTGPGAVMGTDPTYDTTINLGAVLAFSVTATDLNASDMLTLTATASGSLTPGQAGFGQAFPIVLNGPSPLTINLTGTAANAGDIVLQFAVDDGSGCVDMITHTININTVPVIQMPTGPGTVMPAGPDFTATTFIGDPLDFMVTAVDADFDNVMFSATATGGTLPADLGFDPFPPTTIGIAPQTLTFTGTALMLGSTNITFDVDDGRGGTDMMILTVTVVPDTTPPGMITDLSASYSGGLDMIQFSWTAPGDDGIMGTATSYTLKFSPTPITNDTEFNAAATYLQAWTPLPGGSTETQVIDLSLVGYGWYAGVGYFSMKADDEVPNTSLLGGQLTVDTNIAPASIFPVTTVDFGDIAFGNSATVNLDFTNNTVLVDLNLVATTMMGNPEFTIMSGGGPNVFIAPAATHSIVVEFAPTVAGGFAATLDVDHPDTNFATPYTISFTGRGVNDVPEVTSHGFNPHPAAASAMVMVTVEVTDDNSNLPGLNDVTSVTIDLSMVGGPILQPMAFFGDNGPKIGIYDHTFMTAATPGVYELPVTMTDTTGATSINILSHVVTAGTVRVVPAFGTIQAAINASVNGDVVLVQDGTYSGAGNQDLLMGGKLIVVMSENGAATTIIDPSPSGRGFFMSNSGETSASVILGFTIQNCTASAIDCRMDASPSIRECTFLSNTNGAHGGAISLDAAGVGPVAPVIVECDFDMNMVDPGFNDGGAIFAANMATPTIRNCRFTNNSARRGGAILADDFVGTSMSISNCSFTSNSANSRGGAVRISEGTITDCTMTSNTAMFGGAFQVSSAFGTISLTGCIFTDNEAQSGGAGALDDGNPIVTMTDCTFTSNRAIGPGPDGKGGAFFTSVVPSVGLTNVIRCTFSGNSATTNGGVAYLESTDGFIFSDCLMFGNSAVVNGGAIYLSNAPMTDPVQILNSTIADNSAASGGGIYVQDGYLTVTDTIVWFNTATDASDQIFIRGAVTVFPTMTYCDVDTAGLLDVAVRINFGAGYAGGPGNLAADPLFVTGARGNYYLSQIAAGELIDSPCLDAGSNTAMFFGLDLRTTRTDDVTDVLVVDMGAHFAP